MKLPVVFTCLTLAAVLGGCAAAPQSQYYTLSAPAEPVSASAPPDTGFAISLSAVEVPQQVDRPQIVLSHHDGAEVTLLNDSQWAAPLADEIRNALARDLSRRLDVLEIEPRAAPKDLPLWLLSVRVHRFESVYGRQAVLEATWRQEPRNMAKGSGAICRALIEVPVQEGMPELVTGHQRALGRLAGLMADQVAGRPLDAAAGVTLKGCI